MYYPKYLCQLRSKAVRWGGGPSSVTRVVIDPTMLTGTSTTESGLLRKFTLEKLTIASRGFVLCD